MSKEERVEEEVREDRRDWSGKLSKDKPERDATEQDGFCQITLQIPARPGHKRR